MTTGDPRPTLDAPDDDPWLFLEEVEGERALAWVAAENERTQAALAGDAVDADRDALLAVLDRPDKIPHVTRRGGLLYNFWRDGAHPRGLWRRCTLASYRGDEPDWTVLLDLDALAAAEHEDWVWHGAATLPPTHDRAILMLSRGGGDAVTLREFDLDAGRFVADGFVLPEAKGSADWLDRDTLLLNSAGGGAAFETRSGYARTVRVWHRGTPPEQARVVFETDPTNMAVHGVVDRTADDDRVAFLEQFGFYDYAIRFGDRDGARVRLDVPTDARPGWHGDWLTAQPRTAWTAGGVAYPPDTLLGFRLSSFLAGERRPTVLFEPGDRTALKHAFFAGDRLVLSILDELRPVFRIWDGRDGTWRPSDATSLPTTGVVDAWPFDEDPRESDGTLLVSAQDPLTPQSLLMLEGTALASPALLLRQAPAGFDATGLVVTHHEAISDDGERIPYVQTGPAGPPSGDAPVHMTGYGGFQIASLPAYATRTGKLWLERGGTTVLAQIRGGGEFGTRWHEAGRGARKARSHEDFAAVAADLVRRGVTRPGRIAAEGGSNGGLLIANMLTRFPDRFGALFCTIPLVDMRRYSKLLAGASWIAEYGDPDRPEDWEFIRHVSAYHAVAPGQPYPPILLATTRRDDRVHPGHARKMTAKLRALGYRAYFHEPEGGGHGFGNDNASVAAFSALGAMFLRRAIGWEG